MSGNPTDTDEVEYDDWEAKVLVGGKVMHMCERVLTVHKCTPGAVARSGVTIDGVRYEISIAVVPA